MLAHLKILFKEPPVNALLRLASTFLRFLSLDVLHHLLASSHLEIAVKRKDLFCGFSVHQKHLHLHLSFCQFLTQDVSVNAPGIKGRRSFFWML